MISSVVPLVKSFRSRCALVIRPRTIKSAWLTSPDNVCPCVEQNGHPWTLRPGIASKQNRAKVRNNQRLSRNIWSGLQGECSSRREKSFLVEEHCHYPQGSQIQTRVKSKKSFTYHLVIPRFTSNESSPRAASEYQSQPQTLARNSQGKLMASPCRRIGVAA